MRLFFCPLSAACDPRLNPKKLWTAVRTLYLEIGGLWMPWSLFEQKALAGIVFAIFEFEKKDYQLYCYTEEFGVQE
jgi:hypothetical protein